MYLNPKARVPVGFLASHFPDAIAISSITNAIILEFPEVSEEAWGEKLESLPWQTSVLLNSITESPLAIDSSTLTAAKVRVPSSR